MFHPHTSHTIILLSGWAGSGKDGAALLLQEEFGFTRLAFADALRTETAQATGLPLSDFTSRSRKDSPLDTPCLLYPHAQTPRELLQAHARVLRSRDPDLFHRGVARAIRYGDESRIVISDWRTPREAEFLAAELPHAHIVRLRIERHGVPGRPPTDTMDHALDDAPMDAIIRNDGCVSDLREALRAVIHPCLAHAALRLLPTG